AAGTSPAVPAGERASSAAGPAQGAHEPWLDAEGAGPTAGARGGETILIPAFFDGSPDRAGGAIGPADEASDDLYERHPVVEGDTVQDLPTSSPAGKKPRSEAGDKPSNAAAAEILRKMMERRPVPK